MLRFWQGCKRMGIVSVISVLGLGGLGGLGGCSTQPAKSMMSAGQTALPPLETEMDETQEYELALEMARLNIELERYDKAYRLLNKLKQYTQDDVRVYRLYRQYYAQQKQYDMAMVAAQQAIENGEASREDEQAYAHYALLCEAYPQADKIYQAWLLDTENRPLQVAALNNLGVSALIQHRLPQAKDYFEQALALDPLNEKARNNLTLILSARTTE